MIRRKDTQEILPPISGHTQAFAYRPYPFASQLEYEDSSSDEEGARIVERRGVPQAECDRQQLAKLHASAACKRIKEARRLVDDHRFEYACDVVYESQRGFNFLGKANFSTKLLHPMDPPAWSDTTMKLTVANVHSFQVPDPSWSWVSPRWLIDMTLDVDEDGWQYASRFSQRTKWHSQFSAARSFVRRRRWLRLRRRMHHDEPIEDELCSLETTSPSVCDMQGPVHTRRRPSDVAAKIKSKVSRQYVGKSPREGKQAVYTVKDGKYRSHRPQALDVRGQEVRRAKSVTLAIDIPLAGMPLVEDVATDDEDVNERVSLNLQPLDEHIVPRKRHDSGNETDSCVPQIHVDAGLEHVQRSMSTVWQHGHMHERSDELASPTTASPRDEPRLPRLVPRRAPEPTVPREDGVRSLGQYLPASSRDLNAVMMAATRKQRSHNAWSLKPVASAFLGGLASRRSSGVHLMAQSVPVSPHRTHDTHIPPNSPTHIDADSASSTAADSHLSLVINNRARRTSLASSLASSAAASTDDFLASGAEPINTYVNAYAHLALADPASMSRQTLANIVGDKQLVEQSTRTLKSMLSNVALDRERIEFVRECLKTGGSTAACIWYSLPWLHFELLQFDSARTRLIALLLAHAHTCPPDALRYFCASGAGVDEARAMQYMGARERLEYMEMMAQLDQGLCVRALEPMQAWRLVVKPLVAKDPDLFYSDFKLMVVGVAKWELAFK
ncbi:hypothetical protein IW147_004200 [Coemansia sp. RSA 720]|nr:hypothetical protein LPJ76_005057 [Coemansia sp. RSA 638]KAJ2121525.1 hypothetical protein IW147_004200 [Coemansia sp. RSA 720]